MIRLYFADQGALNMVVLSTLLFAAAFAASLGVIAATVAPRWSLMLALLRHGPAADWAPPPPPRRALCRVAVMSPAAAPVRSARAA